MTRTLVEETELHRYFDANTWKYDSMSTEMTLSTCQVRSYFLRFFKNLISEEFQYLVSSYWIIYVFSVTVLHMEL